MEDLFSSFGHITDDMEHSFMDGELKKVSNTSGLGDFHLRSAIKSIKVEKLEKRKGRYREQRDWNIFKTIERNSKIREGDIPRLLSYFLLYKSEIVNNGLYESFLKTKHLEEFHARNVVNRRLDMELNRDLKKNMSSTEERKLSTRYKLMKSYEKFECSDYFDIRCVTELMILAASMISTKRSICHQVKSIGVLLGLGGDDKISDRSDEFFKKSDKMLLLVMGNLNILLGGDLMFVQYQSDANVMVKLKTENEEYLQVVFGDDGANDIIYGDDHWDLGMSWNVFSCDVLRMINDKLSERDIVMRNSTIGSQIFPDIYPCRSILEKIFESGDLMIMKLNNKAYKGIKCFEAIITGVLLTRCDTKVVDRDEFLLTTIRDLKSEDSELGKMAEYWVELVRSLKSDHLLTQIYGLYRLWGHPVVSPVEGIQKVKKIGCSFKEISEELSLRAGYSFLEEFSLRYRSKWGRYPALKIECADGSGKCLEEFEENSYLVQCLKDNVRFDVKKDTYIRSDWNFIRFCKTLDIPETFNLVMIVDDKAISPPRSYLKGVALGSKKLMDPYERRGVLKWMNEDYAECRPFLQRINDHGLDEDHCVIGLYPKERELNSVPRMFSLMSAQMRNYVVVTEHMIADDILPFFPQITMTDDLLGLTKKIYSATRKQTRNIRKRSNSKIFDVTVCLNMDFEKWNLNMRKEATYHVFRRIGELYGMPELINRTYDIFQNSLIYLCDDDAELRCNYNSTTGSYELNASAEKCYIGHLGGFEGLRQKGWTIFTVAVIRMILEEWPVSYKLMGQGDNQVLLITMKTNKMDDLGYLTAEGYWELDNLLNGIIESLKTTFLGLGLPLKTLESWRSESFFLYGKLPVKQGVPLSLSLKKLSRSFPFSNEDSMTMDNMMGSIFTNAQTASMSDVSHLMSYCSGIFETYRGCLMLLRWHPLSGRSMIQSVNENKTWYTFEEETSKHGSSRTRRLFTEIFCKKSLDEIAEAFVLFPKSLGGSNGITEYEFLMRGFPDNQTRDMTYLVELAQANAKTYDPEISRLVLVIKNITKLMFSNGVNLDFLVEDPCALNLFQPPTPLTVLRKEVKRALSKESKFKNQNFMELFRLSNDHRKRELLQNLAGKDTLFPRLLHDCYAASLFGFVDGIVSKVDKTVTVQRMCLEVSEIDIISKVSDTEENFIKFLIWRINERRIETIDEEPTHSCPTNYIRWARNHGWKKNILGVTVPYPSHTLKFSGKMEVLGCSEKDYISCHISDRTPLDMDRLVCSLGNSPPYLGSYTKTKMKTYDRVSLYGSEPLLRRIVKLLKSISWGRLEGSFLHKYLVDLLDSVCDVDDTLFMLSPDDVGGSMEHRYRDSSLKHGALSSSLYGLSTWMHLSTDNFGKYSKGSKNVTLHFQAMLCWIQNIVYEFLLVRCHSKESLIKEFHFHLGCERCIVSVEYEIPDIPEIPKELIPSLLHNPYCYVENVQLTEKDRSIYASKELFKYHKNLTAEDLEEKDNSLLYHEHWAGMILRDLTADAEDNETAIGTGILELSKYPRISFFRINHVQLLDQLALLMIVSTYKSEASRDKHSETALNFSNVMTVLKNNVMQMSPSRFVGLSIIFSWSNKAHEIMEEYDLDIPDATALSLEQCLECAKSLVIKHLGLLNEDHPFESSKYVNLGCSLNIWEMISTRYFVGSRWERFGHCAECRREIILKLSDETLFKLDGSEKCTEGHHWFQKEVLARNIKIVCISEDTMSKRLGSRYLCDFKTVKRNRHERESLLKSVKEMRAHAGCIFVISEKEVAFSDVDVPYEFKREYKKGINIARILNRCAMSEISSGYRLLDLIVGLKMPELTSDESILCLGDGTGSSGRILNLMTGRKILTSSLVDCTIAFPQTFGNSVPTAQFGIGIENFDNSLTKNVVNNIFDDSFIALLDYQIKKKKVSICYCDIELEHEEHQDFDPLESKRFRYSRLIARLSLLDVKTTVAKVRVKDNHDIYHLVETLSARYNNFQLVTTPFCNNLKGDLFVKCQNVKRDIADLTERSLSLKTRKRLDDVMHSYSTGKMFKKIPVEYYDACNQILLSRGILERSTSYLERWFSSHKFNFPMSLSSCTSFYLSIAAARNPIQYAHHLDKKDKYEYDSVLQDVGIRMIALGLAMIEKEEVLSVYLENLHRFVLLRPAETRGKDSFRTVVRYTYEIIFDSYMDSRREESDRVKKHKTLKRSLSEIKDDIDILKPYHIKKDSEVLRVLPLLRLFSRRDECMQRVSVLKSIRFGYMSEINMEKRREKDQEDIVLRISKSSAYSQISK
ncbi:TPA_asm: L [Zanthoxylum betacytorhabdovirus 3]|nr:TPA_asm: L [Zanthoxilum betacytorhabdovirus 3]